MTTTYHVIHSSLGRSAEKTVFQLDFTLSFGQGLQIEQLAPDEARLADIAGRTDTKLVKPKPLENCA